VLIPDDAEIRPRTSVQNLDERLLDVRPSAELDTPRDALERERDRADRAEMAADLERERADQALILTQQATQRAEAADADRRAADARVAEAEADRRAAEACADDERARSDALRERLETVQAQLGGNTRPSRLVEVLFFVEHRAEQAGSCLYPHASAGEADNTLFAAVEPNGGSPTRAAVRRIGKIDDSGHVSGATTPHPSSRRQGRVHPRMPYYEVRYKTDVDTDYRVWRLFQHPYREGALTAFNEGEARQGQLGNFAFDEIGPPQHYVLVEREVMANGLVSDPTGMWTLKRTEPAKPRAE
jgi:hypothetical protein